jgi:Flp pilus assembly protein TadG
MNNLRLKKSIHSKRGSAIIEFAVILPIFMTMLFGMVEFGRVLSVQHIVNSAAREGARVASLPGTDNVAVTTAVQAELTNAGLPLDSITFDPPDITQADPNDSVTVSVVINYESVGWIQGYFPGLNGSSLQGTVVMRKEGLG